MLFNLFFQGPMGEGGTAPWNRHCNPSIYSLAKLHQLHDHMMTNYLQSNISEEFILFDATRITVFCCLFAK